jgi:hypothetical protein
MLLDINVERKIMNSNPHRNNSDFQLRHFLAGSCFTPDGAWMLMYGQMIERESILKVSEAYRIRREANIIDAQRIIEDPNSSKTDKMRAEANIIEEESNYYTWTTNLEAAKMELETIKQIMAELEPYRKYKHLTLLEANEAAQREEWLGEFKNRIENFLFSTGTVPEDQLRAMRNHPDFQTELIPHITGVMNKLSQAKNAVECLTNHTEYFLQDQRND